MNETHCDLRFSPFFLTTQNVSSVIVGRIVDALVHSWKASLSAASEQDERQTAVNAAFANFFVGLLVGYFPGEEIRKSSNQTTLSVGCM